ncbi:competence protein CoiA family protein [Lentilactobacillus sp. Marseille-Q4993]|uniref:competence protein CoiA n=1 Tax=Lentilactobacillus sp. Marseille-Q4993 TaxID=3039492 RepID=UPI0024BD3D33|nr:competence protein CoiA family protein [Lentilactobacillus sp. Marseille-Q4993]
MLIAQKGGQLINAADVDGSGEFYCPECGKPVRYNRGNKKAAYFSHIANLSTMNLENESDQHYAGKMRIAAAFSEIGRAAETERVFSTTGQRADIYIPGNHLVIEYQCSEVSQESVDQRSGDYRGENLSVIWILGDPYLVKKLCKSVVAKFARYKPNLGMYLIYYSDRSDRFVVRHNIQEFAGNLCWQTATFGELEKLIRFCDRFESARTALPERSHWLIRKQAEQLYRNVVMKNQTYLGLINLCYAHHLNLMGCPIICHSPARYNLPLYRHTELSNRVRVLINLIDSDSQVTTNLALDELVKEIIAEDGFHFSQIKNYQMLYRLNLQEFITDLRDFGFLKYTIDGIKLECSPKWFRSFDEKRNALSQ